LSPSFKASIKLKYFIQNVKWWKSHKLLYSQVILHEVDRDRRQN
jgi:hypothetical protein